MNLARIEAVKSRSNALLHVKTEIDCIERKIARLREELVAEDAERNRLWKQFYDDYREFSAECGTVTVDALIEANDALKSENDALHVERTRHAG